MRELRRDFRVLYGCCYDDVRPDEALDLICCLGYGSLYRADVSGDYDFVWPLQTHKTVDISDRLLAFMQLYATHSTENAQLSTRPGDARRTEEAKRKAKDVRKRIEGTSWEEA